MNRLFGTDGVRGVANRELTPELAFELGRAGAYVLGRNKKRPLMLIGRDTRLSGPLLEDALCAGVLSMGGDVIKLGVIPTPAVAYLVRDLGADCGAVISASHNSFEYNGIKFFNSEGYKLADEIEDEIEDILARSMSLQGTVEGADVGRRSDLSDEAKERYIAYLRSTAKDLDLTGRKIVLDCAGGAGSYVGPALLKSLGAEVIALSAEPDGLNINKNCGSTHPARLQQKVLEEKADLGLALDGDGDRLLAVDEKGQLVDGDKILYICGAHMQKQGRLPDDKITVTVMSNLGFHKAIEALGCSAYVTKVGDRYVLEKMKESGCALGGEQSGHIIFLEHSTTGDGLVTALQILLALQAEGKPLSVLAEPMKVFPQVLKNASVKNENKNRFESQPEIAAAMAEMEKKMAGRGRVLIRPSGTEPLVRVMLEGEDPEEIRAMAEELAALITRKLG